MLHKWYRTAVVLVASVSLFGCSCGDSAPAGAEVSAALSVVEAESPVSMRGEAASVVTVTLLDESGSPVSGVEVAIESSRGDEDDVTQPSSATDDDGIAEGSIASSVEGVAVVSAIADGVELESTAEVEFFDEQACPDGEVWCGDDVGCVELGTVEHCVECHDECEAPANAEPYCDDGCGWSCAEGYASCDDDPETGCETELGTVDDCLSCGDVCEGAPNASARCGEEGCSIHCDEGYGSCDGDLSTGCETELEDGECPPKDCPDGLVDCGAAGCVELGTVEHCLECHDGCEAPANADAICLDDGCGFECHEGFGNCDNDPSTGCESHLDDQGLCPSGCHPGEADCGDGCVPLNTTDNCGECGIVCEAPANSEAVCLSSGCSYECLPGFGDCDGDPETGCEQPLDTDLHCGACGAACDDPPNAAGFCEDPEAGACGYVCVDGFADCDGDPETGCETDLSVGTCCDHESFVELSSPCLTAGAGGLSVVHVEIRDVHGQLVSGAEVDVDAQGLLLVGDVVESTSEPGVYWVLVEEPGEVGTHEISATATYDGDWACGAQVTIEPVALTVAPPLAVDGGGTGGCIPRGDNLRVRAVDEDGHPIEGAFVMIGEYVGDQVFHGDYEAFLAGDAPDLANDALTDQDGYACFLDLGDVLRDPSSMITVGADGHVYSSVVGFDASEVQVALEPLQDPPDTVSLMGEVVPQYHLNYPGRVAMSLVTESLDIADLARFDIMDLLEEDKEIQGSDLLCSDITFWVPGNIHFPDQSPIALLCSLRATPPQWLLSPLRGSAGALMALQGDLDAYDAIDIGENIPQLISAMSFRQVGVAEGVDTQDDQSDVDIELTAELAATMPVEAVDAPQGELWLLSVGDIDGGDGDGRLFVQGVAVDESASSLAATLPTANPEGPFAVSRHLAMGISIVAGQGASAVLDRETVGRDAPRVLDDFFSTPGSASVFWRTFSWTSVANSASPADYHVARSILRRVTPPPQGAYRSEEEPFWVVYSPGGMYGFSLPTLPPDAPRASTQGYLTPAWGQSNRWFLGLYYLGLNPVPGDLEAGEIDFSWIERDLTHLAITERTM